MLLITVTTTPLPSISFLESQRASTQMAISPSIRRPPESVIRALSASPSKANPMSQAYSVT